MRKLTHLFTRTRGSHPDDFSGRVIDFFRRHRRENFRIASGYIGGGLWNVLSEWGLHDAKIELLLGNINPEKPVLSAELYRCLKELLKFPRLDLKLDPSLHAKLFIAGDKAALLGSMNLSEPGLHRRSELLLETSDPRHVTMATEIFDIWWEDAKSLSAALQKARISKRGAKTDSAGVALPVHGDDSAWKGKRKPHGGSPGPERGTSDEHISIHDAVSGLTADRTTQRQLKKALQWIFRAIGPVGKAGRRAAYLRSRRLITVTIGWFRVAWCETTDHGIAAGFIVPPHFRAIPKNRPTGLWYHAPVRSRYIEWSGVRFDAPSQRLADAFRRQCDVIASSRWRHEQANKPDFPILWPTGSREQEGGASRVRERLTRLLKKEPLPTHKVKVLFGARPQPEKEEAWQILLKDTLGFNRGTFNDSWLALKVSKGETTSLNRAYRESRGAGKVSE